MKYLFIHFACVDLCTNSVGLVGSKLDTLSKGREL